jgi:PAS domain S-box-containing protein
MRERRIGGSLRWRLPLLIAGLIALVVATFLGVAYREVQADLRHAASARAVAAASQVGGLFGQSSQQRLTEFRRLASDPVFLRFVDEPSESTREKARDRLAAFPNSGPQVVEVWNDAGVRLLTVATPPSADAMLPVGAPPTASGIGPLRRAGESVFSEAAVEIQPDASADDRSTNRPRGWLIVRRPATAAPTADVLNRLVGADARIGVGNRDGGVWTNLVTAIDPPRINLAQIGPAEDRRADGSRNVGALEPIRGTPWSIWVAFPESSVLEPARAFLQRMLFMAVAFLVFSTAVVAFVSARITLPLAQLTAASEAIAGGEYSRRVPVNRGDEIGRLSGAFNAMTEQVEQSHRELEQRVRERTAGLERAGLLLEQHLREAKQAREELDQFFSLSLDLLCIADAEGRFTRVNPAWEPVLGWSHRDLTRTLYLDFVHPDDRAETAAESAKLASGGTTLAFENRYRHKDGSYRWLSWKAASDPQRGVIYAAARDVTREKQAAAALQQHAAELATVNRELEAFSYSVSHDLRAPLRHISGFAMMLEESASRSLDAEGRRLLATIRAAATHMGRLIDDLLSLSRVGRTELARSNVDLDRLGRDVQREVSRDLNGREVDWRLHDLPTVHGDPALLRLVLVNLLSNAVKYSAPRSRAEIEVGAVSGDGETVVFVRDNGVGFDMKYADKLFGVFQRLHNSDEFEGTGIGLANVRRIVQRHGGRTWAEGHVDAGATFYFSLPDGSVS